MQNFGRTLSNKVDMLRTKTIIIIRKLKFSGAFNTFIEIIIYCGGSVPLVAINKDYILQ